ncbi:hypothetical protein OSTOST_01591, partial [Ostertagia ostertagi]
EECVDDKRERQEYVEDLENELGKIYERCTLLLQRKIGGEPEHVLPHKMLLTLAVCLRKVESAAGSSNGRSAAFVVLEGVTFPKFAELRKNHHCISLLPRKSITDQYVDKELNERATKKIGAIKVEIDRA